MNYSIQWCPIPFHDLMEIFDFLSSLSVVRLYQFDGLYVLLNGFPIMQLVIVYVNWFISHYLSNITFVMYLYVKYNIPFVNILY